MRRTGRRSQQETKQQLIRPENEQEKIDDALSLMATRVRGVLTERMFEMWHRDLAVYPLDAIEWALDTYGRMAKRLPALGDITELLKTWQGSVPTYGCEQECQELHGKGYSTNDLAWLLKRRMANHTPGAKWSIADWEQAFKELDAQRAGGAPKWRTGPSGEGFLRETA